MGIGFENPAWLLGVGLIAPLVWLYLRVRPRPPAMVSSLRIWRHVPSPSAPPRRRPKLPPLFFLQALLILVSSFALADPYRREPKPPGPPRDAVIVVDVSASMQSANEGATRFSQAIDSAGSRADELAAEGRQITVIRAGPQPAVLASGLDGEGARAQLAALAAQDTSANLTAAVELAATLAGTEGRIDVYSDTPAEDIVMSRDARAAATVHVFGETGSNVAVSDVRVQTNPFGEEATARLLVTVRNYAPEPREVGLEIVPLEAVTAEEIIEEVNAQVEGSPEAVAAAEAANEAEGTDETAAPPEPQLSHTLHLEPGTQEIVSVDGVRWAGAFEARLTADDDLALDDVVYGYVPRPRSIDLLLVTDDRKLGDRFAWLAERAGSFSVRTVTSAQYDSRDVGEITVFDRFAPKLPPASNVVYLAPPTGNADITVVQNVADVKIAERRDHALLHGVTTTPALLGDVSLGLAPSGLRPVLLGQSQEKEIALIQAGDVGGRQIVATAFRIDPNALTRADDLPTLIFTLNLLSFLSPESPDAPLLRMAGERLRAGSGSASPIEEIDGPGGLQKLGAGSDLTLDRAGVYEATSRAGTRPVYVSFVDAIESDLRLARTSPVDADQDTGDAPPPAPEEAAEDDGSWKRIPYLRQILFAVALILIAEWLLVAAVQPGHGRARRTPS